MFAVIFEVYPEPEQWDTYLSYAQSLRPDLERTDGFVNNERFSSLCRPGWALSLSIWRDEDAVARWRNFPPHHKIQQKGRSEVFRDYHLRVGEVIHDNQLPTGQRLAAQPSGETRVWSKLVALTEAAPQGLPSEPEAGVVAARLGAPDRTTVSGLVDWDVFRSIYQPGKFVLRTSWRDLAAAEGWPVPPDGGIRHRRIRVIRDYGMFDRAEAPQYYPPVPPQRPVRIV
jgi:heme-degrading monooxygenase HmoA